MKTCIKCGGNAYTEFAYGCDHDMGPEPVALQVSRRGEMVWKASVSFKAEVFEATHPLKEEAIRLAKEWYADRVKDKLSDVITARQAELMRSASYSEWMSMKDSIIEAGLKALGVMPTQYVRLTRHLRCYILSNWDTAPDPTLPVEALKKFHTDDLYVALVKAGYTYAEIQSVAGYKPRMIELLKNGVKESRIDNYAKADAALVLGVVDAVNGGERTFEDWFRLAVSRSSQERKMVNDKLREMGLKPQQYMGLTPSQRCRIIVGEESPPPTAHEEMQKRDFDTWFLLAVSSYPSDQRQVIDALERKGFTEQDYKALGAVDRATLLVYGREALASRTEKP